MSVEGAERVARRITTCWTTRVNASAMGIVWVRENVCLSADGVDREHFWNGGDEGGGKRVLQRIFGMR